MALAKTMITFDGCGCSVVRDSREHDEAICDENGENWMCRNCYDGRYEEKEDEEEEIDEGCCERCGEKFPVADTREEFKDPRNPDEDTEMLIETCYDCAKMKCWKCEEFIDYDETYICDVEGCRCMNC